MNKRYIVFVLVLALALSLVLMSCVDDGNDKAKEDDKVTWGEWSITKPTADSVGKVERIASDGSKESHELPKLDSDKYTVEVVKSATYETTGKVKYTIKIGDISHSFEIDTPTIDADITLYVNGTKLDAGITHNKSTSVTLGTIEERLGTKDYVDLVMYSSAECREADKIADITAYARDNATFSLYIIKRYNATFVDDAGKTIDTKVVAYGTKYGDIFPEAHKVNMELDGWCRR